MHQDRKDLLLNRVLVAFMEAQSAMFKAKSALDILRMDKKDAALGRMLENQSSSWNPIVGLSENDIDETIRRLEEHIKMMNRVEEEEQECQCPTCVADRER